MFSLQNQIKKRLEKELGLKKDIKIYWISIDLMIERYSLIKEKVKEALKYFNYLHLLER